MLNHSKVDRASYGTLPDGRAVDMITLRGAGRLRMRFVTFGGIMVSLFVPDREGNMADVTLGYDSLDDYRADPHYCGALIGRYANRIARGRFSIDGREYQAAINAPPNHIHGGPNGFHSALWHCDTFSKGGDIGAVLTHTTHPSDDGYPGTLSVRVRYTVTEDDTLIVDYSATTDEATPANFSFHPYFNLAGHERGSVLGHQLTINASRFTVADETRVPTGELRSVAGTPLDFTTSCEIGARIDADDEQIRIGGGYDPNFVLDRDDDTTLAFAARLYEPVSGRMLEMYTTQPGLQLYSGNGFDRVVGKQGCVYDRRCAVALETQHFPDSPNHPEFPNTILEPGRELRSRTTYRFSTQLADRHA